MSSPDRSTGATLFANALESYSIPYVFGNPGTTELPLIDAVADSDECEYVMALHEDIAVGAASGYAKTRQYHSHHDEDVNPVGVVNLHAAPGLAHGLGNIHGASYTGAPLVVTAGIQRRDFQHEEPLLSGDLVEMTQQFTKWSAMVNHVDALPDMLRRAVRTALTPPTGPVFLGLPLDVLREQTTEDVAPLGVIPGGGRGEQVQVERAADLLADATEPVMIAGDGIARSGRDAINSAVEAAEAAGLRVHGEILGSEVSFPGDHEQWHSFLPPKESVAREHMDTDTLLFVGCSTNTTITAYETPLVPDDATCIHVSDDPWQVGKNTRADAAIVGDPGSILDEIADAASDRIDEKTRKERVDQVRGYADEPGDVADEPRSEFETASKSEFVDTLRSVAPDAFIVDESITTKYVLLDRWPLKPEQFLSTKGGGLGYGLPSAVGAALAESLRPDPRDVVGLVGDGSYLYYPHALYTAARYGVDLTVVVPNNQSYTVLKNNTTDMLGGSEPDYDFDEMGIDMDLTVDIPSMAESQSVNSRTVIDPDEIEAALQSAFDASGPSLVDVRIHD
ncbi:thiamine pyrophosphate-binding protein [Halostella pelagica]|uniref:thiamine pyrophosphate-binding protein n=1 Tax=Halostella pelagica TaxID=2583824 RepID=UPI00107FD65F|nr:thiamine pyrophosphate-binding protein [Halostella pelagica]